MLLFGKWLNTNAVSTRISRHETAAATWTSLILAMLRADKFAAVVTATDRFSLADMASHGFLLVVESVFTHMDHRLAIIEDGASDDFGEVKIMVAGRDTGQHSSMQIGVGFL